MNRAHQFARFATPFGLLIGAALLDPAAGSAQDFGVTITTRTAAGTPVDRIRVETNVNTARVLLVDSYIDANATRIQNVASPLAATDAATKSYVDGALGSAANRWAFLTDGTTTAAAAGADTLKVVAGSGLTLALDAGAKSFTFSIPPGAVTNAMLATPSLTLAVGPGLTGGGIVSLGTASVPLDLSPTGVTPGSYTRANISVDAHGRLSAAANGPPVFLSGSDVAGILPVALGGTGAALTETGGPGQYLKQLAPGAAVSTGPITVEDLPAGSAAYIQNQASVAQPASLWINGDARVGVLTVGSLSNDPAGIDGAIYYNTASAKLRAFENGGWVNLASPTAASAASPLAFTGKENIAPGSPVRFYVRTPFAAPPSSVRLHIWAEPFRADVSGVAISSDSAGTPAGTVQAETVTGAISTESAGIPGGTVSNVSAGTPTGAISTESAGTPMGSISNTSAGTPTGAISTESAGTPSGSLSSASAGLPSIAISTESAGTPTGQIIGSGAHNHVVMSGIYGGTASSTLFFRDGTTYNAAGGSVMRTYLTDWENGLGDWYTSQSAHTHSFQGYPLDGHNHVLTPNPLSPHTHTFTGSPMDGHNHVLTLNPLAVHTHAFTGSLMDGHNHVMTLNPHSHGFTGSPLPAHDHAAAVTYGIAGSGLPAGVAIQVGGAPVAPSNANPSAAWVKIADDVDITAEFASGVPLLPGETYVEVTSNSLGRIQWMVIIEP